MFGLLLLGMVVRVVVAMAVVGLLSWITHTGCFHTYTYTQQGTSVTAVGMHKCFSFSSAGFAVLFVRHRRKTRQLAEPAKQKKKV